MFALYDFKKCVMEQADELHKTRQNLYIHIQKLQDLFYTFRDFNIMAHNALIQLTCLKGMVKDMTKWQVQFKDGSKKPSHLIDYQLQFYQIACNNNINRAQELETTTTEMCIVCENSRKHLKWP